MKEADAFFDSNVLLYLASTGPKPARSRELLDAGGIVNVQVLNEFAAVTRGKFAMPWLDIHEILAIVHFACRVEPLSLRTHVRGLAISQRYRFGIYDSMIVAAALEAGCVTLFTEDMQHGQRIEGLTIRNPFADL
jgi:predicted nucleic acid-binding protein